MRSNTYVFLIRASYRHLGQMRSIVNARNSLDGIQVRSNPSQQSGHAMINSQTQPCSKLRFSRVPLIFFERYSF